MWHGQRLCWPCRAGEVTHNRSDCARRPLIGATVGGIRELTRPPADGLVPADRPRDSYLWQVVFVQNARFHGGGFYGEQGLRKRRAVLRDRSHGFLGRQVGRVPKDGKPNLVSRNAEKHRLPDCSGRVRHPARISSLRRVEILNQFLRRILKRNKVRFSLEALRLTQRLRRLRPYPAGGRSSFVRANTDAPTKCGMLNRFG